jgi:hypothetical protein
MKYVNNTEENICIKSIDINYFLSGSQTVPEKSQKSSSPVPEKFLIECNVNEMNITESNLIEQPPTAAASFINNNDNNAALAANAPLEATRSGSLPITLSSFLSDSNTNSILSVNESTIVDPSSSLQMVNTKSILSDKNLICKNDLRLLKKTYSDGYIDFQMVI